MLFVANKERIPLCEFEITNLPVGPMRLLNLLLTSCLRLGTMRRLSVIEHRAMMLECMLFSALLHVLHGEVSRNHLKILDVGQTHGSNQKRCTTMFHSPQFSRNEGNPDTRSHGNFAVHAANG